MRKATGTVAGATVRLPDVLDRKILHSDDQKIKRNMACQAIASQLDNISQLTRGTPSPVLVLSEQDSILTINLQNHILLPQFD